MFSSLFIWAPKLNGRVRRNNHVQRYWGQKAEVRAVHGNIVQTKQHRPVRVWQASPVVVGPVDKFWEGLPSASTRWQALVPLGFGVHGRQNAGDVFSSELVKEAGSLSPGFGGIYFGQFGPSFPHCTEVFLKTPRGPAPTRGGVWYGMAILN